MKTNEEMYQSILSRREEYRRKKAVRLHIIKRTVPAAACLCIAAFIGISRFGHYQKLPDVPIQTETSTVTADMTTQITSSSEKAVSETSVQSTTKATITSDTTASRTSATSAALSLKTTESATQTANEYNNIADTTVSASTAKITSTAETTATAVSSETETTAVESNMPVPINAQPIRFNDVDEMTETVNNGDVSEYPEQFRQAYLSAFGRFKCDGFIYKPNNSSVIPSHSVAPNNEDGGSSYDGNDGNTLSNTNVSESYSISLRDDLGNCVFPYAVYEDIGVGYYVTFMEKTYHVTFYCADVNVLAESSDIADYMQKRTGRQSDRTISFGSNAVSLHFSDNGQNYASAFIDDEHYFDVVTSASEKELISFLELFSYEKIGI